MTQTQVTQANLAEELYTSLPEDIWQKVDDQVGRLHSAIDDWASKGITVQRAMGRVRSAAFNLTREARGAVRDALAEAFGARREYLNGRTAVREEAIAIVTGWKLAMDHPETAGPLEIHHVELAVILEALSQAGTLPLKGENDQ